MLRSPSHKVSQDCSKSNKYLTTVWVPVYASRGQGQGQVTYQGHAMTMRTHGVILISISQNILNQFFKTWPAQTMVCLWQVLKIWHAVSEIWRHKKWGRLMPLPQASRGLYGMSCCYQTLWVKLLTPFWLPLFFFKLTYFWVILSLDSLLEQMSPSNQLSCYHFVDHATRYMQYVCTLCNTYAYSHPDFY